MHIQGQIVDIENRRIYSGEVRIENGKIVSVIEKQHDNKNYILPGFIDAHIHIESSMLVPSEFAKLAVLHGTVGTISDPHEIANVLGKNGVYYMIENGKKVPLKFHFGAPSCVPATTFESAGAIIDSEGIKELMASPDIYYLAEMMNYPGVLFDDAEVLKKIEWAKHFNKPVDGHARGEQSGVVQQGVDGAVLPEDLLDADRAEHRAACVDAHPQRPFLRQLLQFHPHPRQQLGKGRHLPGGNFPLVLEHQRQVRLAESGHGRHHRAGGGGARYVSIGPVGHQYRRHERLLRRRSRRHLLSSANPMKFRFCFILTVLLGLASAPAQWITRSYPLVTGWNGIWLAGDASYTTVAELFSAYPAVTEVWRWNPNADQTTFVQAPSEPTTSSDEWTVWKRNDPRNNC